MQCMDYKSEVDRRAIRMASSIQSRVGYIPNSIQKHILYLNELKPPGDALYDKIRYKGGVNNSNNSRINNSLSSNSYKINESYTSSTDHSKAKTSFQDTVNQNQNQNINSILSVELLKNEVEVPSILKNIGIQGSGEKKNIIVSSPHKYPFANIVTTSHTSALSPSQSSIVNHSFSHSSSSSSPSKNMDNKLSYKKNQLQEVDRHSGVEKSLHSLSSIKLPNTSTYLDEEIDRRQKIIQNLFPRAVSLQDTTGIQGIQLLPG